MQRFSLVLCAVIVVIIFAFQQFQPKFQLPLPPGQNEEDEQTVREAAAGPSQALNDIYFNVNILAVQEATAERLESDFGIDCSNFTAVLGRYTDGRFGAADVILIRPRVGWEDQARETLQAIKLARTNQFRNYDIYNSYSLAANGQIFQRGGYYILTMIDNAEQVRSILESYISR